MFKRKPKSKASFLVLHSSNRGSDIVKPDNTSLIVNESDTEADNLPRDLTSIFSDDEDGKLGDSIRRSSSLMKSLSQKKQSTPSKNNALIEQENNLSQVRKTKVVSPAAEENISYFEEVLKVGGAAPLPENSSFLMSEDQAVFSIKVNNKLKENAGNIDKFINSLKEKMQNFKYLQKMLAHTLTAENCEAARGPVQEPLMRMLLNVECLRTDLIKLLLGKVGDLIMDNRAESENIQLVSCILGQMRFLQNVQDTNIASKLLEILDAATVNVKREIIFLLPEIISKEETQETCIWLIEMLKLDEVLTNVIIDALTNLPLCATLKSLVCSRIVQRLDKCPIEFLPTLVQFVLNKCESEELSEVVNGLRNNLPFSPQHYEMRMPERDSGKKYLDMDSYVKLTFENLKFSVMSSKGITDAWIKIISSFNSCNNFRCVDLIVLIIFYSCLLGRKNQILQLIRNKIKSNILTQYHVQNMFKILPVVTEEYSATILEMASVFLKSNDPKISVFGAVLYRECFIHFHFYMKQIVISEILLHVGTGTGATVNAALNILRELCESEKEALSQHTASIMGLLVKVADLDLMQARLLMDVIADLVFFEPLGNRASAQDELQIFIRKQLISSKLDQCKKGVLAAIMFGKHSGKDEVCVDSGHIRSNLLLELAMGSNGTLDSRRGFFNDEFSNMVKESSLSKSFLEIWSKKVLAVVMDNLFVRNNDIDFREIPSSSQYGLGNEGIQELVFPAVEFTGKSDSKSLVNMPVSVIPSTLRLFWCLEKNLSRILPVFYASVLMPESTVYDDFNNFDELQKTKIMNSLFICGNYLIECVNALCAHGILDKAVIRVKQLISVRKLMAKYISLIPDFVPPLCQFYSPTQRVFIKRKVSEKKGKKGLKRKLNEEYDEKSFVESQRTQKSADACPGEDIFSAEQTAQEANLLPYSSFFRELDFVTNKLLSTDFKFDLNSEILGVTKQQDGFLKPALETCDILFLLEDLIHKSEQMLKSTEVTFNFKSKPTVSLIQRITPEEFIVGSIKILPELLNKIEIFSKYCENLLKSVDWVYHSPGLYVRGACHIKLAVAAGLKFVANVLSWRGFHTSENKLLKDLLLILCSRRDCKISSSLESCDVLAMNAAKYLTTFSKTVLVLSGGLSIVKSFQSCFRHASSERCCALADLCHEFLCRTWFTVTGDPDGGPLYNQQVDFLLKTYFSYVEDKLEAVRVSAKTAFAEVAGLADKGSALKTFKTINKNNFPLLYRKMCEALASTSADEFSSAGNHEKQLQIWNKVVETLLVLVETAKIHSSRVILASLLKRSQSIIQLFLCKGMPVVECALRVKSVEVLTLLKSFQMVTRFLHSICCHSRITNDSVVAAHVPAIRSLCERLTLEVKGMLILNGIPMDCITIAILKNRDIKGNDIISQGERKVAHNKNAENEKLLTANTYELAEVIDLWRETFDEDSDGDSQLPPEDMADADEKLNESINEEDAQGTNSEAY